MSAKKVQDPINRVIELINNDLDYNDLGTNFYNLLELVKGITGINFGLINLIDAQNIWPIAQNGTNALVSPLEDAPCQFTIQENDHFEVKDLTKHAVLRDKDYVKNSPFYKYYFGVPLKAQNGTNVGSLCFFDTQTKTISETQINLLKIIASEIASKIDTAKEFNNLQKEFFEHKANHLSLANSVRNPLAGIVGLSDVLIDQFDDLNQEEARDFNELINTSSKSILNVLDEVIIKQKKQELDVNTLNLSALKEKLILLYSPLLAAKQLNLSITINKLKNKIFFLKSHVNFIIGNLLVEILLYLNNHGKLTISLDLMIKVDKLYITAVFTAEGMINNNNLPNNEIIKVYQNKVEELGGELILNLIGNQIFDLKLPLKSI